MRALRGVLSALPYLAALSAVLLGTPGLVDGVWVWPRAWTFLAVYGGATALASGLLAALRPASFDVRQQGIVAPARKQQPLVDALGAVLFAGFMLGWLAFIPVDVFHLKLLPAPPMAVRAAGMVGVIAGICVTHIAIAQNRFAAPTIHDQSAERQQVIQTGLYGVVRHPFYAGGLLVYAGAPLWLGSYAGALADLGFLGLTLARIMLIEEPYLRRHLPDYAAYARRVRSMLIPGLL
jgi:protein-S-isoprenylcysteine O-methyltransferase Ste14